MQATKQTLLIVLLMHLAVSCPAQCQQSRDNNTHPYRLRRPTSDGSTQKSPQQSPGRQPLQGGVSRVGIVDEGTGKARTPLIGDVDQAFLTGRADELIQTPPVLRGAVGKMAPPSLYRGWLEKAHPRFSLSTNTMADNRLVVVYGKYDDTGRTLAGLGVRFTTINTFDLDHYDLSRTQVLVVDCPGGLSPQATLKVRDFVANGGYLFTTDWLLDRLDEQIFPGYIMWNRAMNKKKMYDAEIVGKHPFLFKRAVTNAHWKMDIHCHLIRILNKDAVRVLAVSRQLVADDPDRQGILAVVFPFGRGYVLHMVAHFDRTQKGGYYLPDPAPVIGISLRQAIALNFVVAGLTGTRL